MSPREFDGAVAREVHEHFDADGNLTGTTVVTRESMWDDETRERVLDLADYERSICGCGCNLPVAESHKAQPFRVGAIKCLAGATLAKHRRAEAKKAQDEKKPEGWNDGIHYYIEPAEGDT